MKNNVKGMNERFGQGGYQTGNYQNSENRNNGYRNYGENPSGFYDGRMQHGPITPADDYRWNSGYDKQFASKKDESPSLTSRILAFFNECNSKRAKKKLKNQKVVKVKNVVYQENQSAGKYKDYDFLSKVTM